MMLGFMGQKQNDSQTVRIRRGMREITLRALQHSDTVAIDILAAVIVPPPVNLIEHPTSKAGVTTSMSYSPREVRDQFQELFELDEAGLVDARRRGEEAIKEEKYAVAKELYDQQENKRYVLSFPFISLSPSFASTLSAVRLLTYLLYAASGTTTSSTKSPSSPNPKR
jgi:hypothetical protein